MIYAAALVGSLNLVVLIPRMEASAVSMLILIVAHLYTKSVVVEFRLNCRNGTILPTAVLTGMFAASLVSTVAVIRPFLCLLAVHFRCSKKRAPFLDIASKLMHFPPLFRVFFSFQPGSGGLT